jgi:hypothetical protein
MGILGSLFGGGGGTTKIGKKAAKDLYKRAQTVADTPYVPYEGNRVADANPTLQAAIAQASSASGAGNGSINKAVNLAQSAGSYTPSTVTANPITASLMAASSLRPVNDITAASLAPVGDVTGAAVDPSTVRDVNASSFLDYDVNQYMNPYLQTVAGNVMSDLALQRDRQRLNDNAAAVRAGAFGGDRQGVADALTNEAFMRTSASTLSDLYKSGFDLASGLITTDADRALQAGESNQTRDLSVAGTNAGYDQAARLANQTAQLSVAGQNAGFQQDAAKVNQANQYNTALQDAQMIQEANRLNMAAQNTASTTNASNSLEAALANQEAGLTANEQALLSSNILGEIGNNQARNAVVGSEVALKAGTAQQLIDQAKLDAEYDAYLREQGWAPSMINLLTDAAGVAAGTRSNQSNGIIPGLSSMFSGGSQSAANGIYSMFK